MLWIALAHLLRATPGPVEAAMTPAALTAADRCDRCAAQAYVRVQLPISGATLDFCAHHFRRHEDGLADAILILDDRPKQATTA